MDKYFIQKANAILSYIILAAIIGVMTFFIVYNANWVVGDQLQFLNTTALGKVLPIGNYVMPYLGRFFPFGLMDYNLLLLFPQGETVTAHFVLNAIGFVAMSIFLTLLFRNIVKTKDETFFLLKV